MRKDLPQDGCKMMRVPQSLCSVAYTRTVSSLWGNNVAIAMTRLTSMNAHNASMKNAEIRQLSNFRGGHTAGQWEVGCLYQWVDGHLSHSDLTTEATMCT